MRHFVLVCALLSPSTAILNAQTFDYAVTNVVNTTKAEVRQILKLWIEYLGSTPDSVYDNPHLNAREKVEYGFKYFDFAGHSLFANLSARELVEGYKPTVLNINGFDDHYETRTLFYAEGLPPESKGSNPPRIVIVAAIKADSQWKLANILPFATSKWIERCRCARCTARSTQRICARRDKSADAKVKRSRNLLRGIQSCDTIPRSLPAHL